MSLSCECNEDYYDYWYRVDKIFIKADDGLQCYSCKQSIKKGSDIIRFLTYEYDENGDEINEKYEYHCAECGEIFLNLDELGFCIDFEDNMKQLFEQYKNEYIPENAKQ